MLTYTPKMRKHVTCLCRTDEKHDSINKTKKRNHTIDKMKMKKKEAVVEADIYAEDEEACNVLVPDR